MAKIEIDRDTLIRAALEELTLEEAAKLLAKIILKTHSKGIKPVESPLTSETVKQIGIQYGNLFKTPSEIARLNNISLSQVKSCLHKLGYTLPEDLNINTNVKKRDPNRRIDIIKAIKTGSSTDEIAKEFSVKPSYIYHLRWQEKRKK